MRVPKFTYSVTHTPDKRGNAATIIQADSAVEAIRLFALRAYTINHGLELIDIAKVQNEDDRFHQFCLNEIDAGTLSTIGD